MRPTISAASRSTMTPVFPDDARRPTMTTTISIHADELRPGDLLDYAGQPRRITNVVRRSGFAWPIAVDGTGWAMALGHRPLTVRRG
jgi:hypothetical protein